MNLANVTEAFSTGALPIGSVLELKAFVKFDNPPIFCLKMRSGQAVGGCVAHFSKENPPIVALIITAITILNLNKFKKLFAV